MRQKILAMLQSNGMRARALRGTFFSVAGFGTQQLIRLGSNLILTRLLFPEAFGMMALMQVFLLALTQFSDFSLRPSIVQSARGDDPQFLNTAWTIQVGRGVLIWVIACATALPVATFYEQQMLSEIIPFLALTAVLNGFTSTNVFRANRHLLVGRLTLLEIGSQLVGICVMILLAWLWQTVWALVVGSIVTNLVKAVLSHIILAGPRNRFAWDKAAFWELFHFGKYIMFGTIAGFFINNGDRAVLGKYITLSELAIYTVALTMASLPQRLTVHLVERVLFPLYKNRPPAENASNRVKIGQARGLLLFGVFSLASVFALVGEPLIAFLYDPRYHAAGTILVLVSLTIIPWSVIVSYNRVFLANGNAREFTILTVCIAVLRLSLLLFLVSRYGIVGAMIAAVATDLLAYPFIVWRIRRYRAWYPVQDAVAYGCLIVLCVAVMWLSPNSMAMIPWIQ